MLKRFFGSTEFIKGLERYCLWLDDDSLSTINQYKIGVTGGKVESRIANAAHDATYLLADVEVVASYKLAGINRTKLEGIFHRFGHPVRPKEWFLVPLHVIDEAVRRIRDGSITNVAYDPKTASFVGLAQ